MLKRRHVLIGLTAQATTYGFRSHAAVSTVTKRLGILSLGKPDDAEEVIHQRIFFESLARKGWAEGRNLTVVRAYSGGSETPVERLVALARELVASRVDVIQTGGVLTTLAAARATERVPIVFTQQMPYLIEQGLVQSYARPGRNVTGPGLSQPLSSKRLSLLKQLVPSATRLAGVGAWGVLMDVLSVSGGRVDAEKLALEAARAAGFEMRWFGTRPGLEIEAVFEDIGRWGAHAVYTGRQDIPYTSQVAEMALRRKLPSAFAIREAVHAGGLLAYGIQNAGEERLASELAASYVDRILRGANPATLPIELAMRYELVINAKTAETLGLAIPHSLRVSAEIIR